MNANSATSFVRHFGRVVKATDLNHFLIWTSVSFVSVGSNPTGVAIISDFFGLLRYYCTQVWVIWVRSKRGTEEFAGDEWLSRNLRTLI